MFQCNTYIPKLKVPCNLSFIIVSPIDLEELSYLRTEIELRAERNYVLKDVYACPQLSEIGDYPREENMAFLYFVLYKASRIL